MCHWCCVFCYLVIIMHVTVVLAGWHECLLILSKTAPMYTCYCTRFTTTYWCCHWQIMTIMTMRWSSVHDVLDTKVPSLQWPPQRLDSRSSMWQGRWQWQLDPIVTKSGVMNATMIYSSRGESSNEYLVRLMANASWWIDMSQSSQDILGRY